MVSSRPRTQKSHLKLERHELFFSRTLESNSTWKPVVSSRPRMQKSHLKRHELFFSRTLDLNYPASSSAGLNHQKSSKRGVRGVSSAISPFLGGPGTLHSSQIPKALSVSSVVTPKCVNNLQLSFEKNLDKSWR